MTWANLPNLLPLLLPLFLPPDLLFDEPPLRLPLRPLDLDDFLLLHLLLQPQSESEELEELVELDELDELEELELELELEELLLFSTLVSVFTINLTAFVVILVFSIDIVLRTFAPLPPFQRQCSKVNPKEPAT